MASSRPPPDSTPDDGPAPPAQSVMLVDDEPAYLDLLQQLLTEHLACPVYSFTRPAEALSQLDQLAVGLIVTDYHMPAMNGLEFVREAQRRRPEVPVIMITAHAVTIDAARRAELPALKAVVRKPFRWTALAGEISRHWPGHTPPFPPRSA